MVGQGLKEMHDIEVTEVVPVESPVYTQIDQGLGPEVYSSVHGARKRTGDPMDPPPKRAKVEFVPFQKVI